MKLKGFFLLSLAVSLSQALEASALQTITPISVIQGTPKTFIKRKRSDVSPLYRQWVTVEAVVIGDFQNSDRDTTRNLKGFYIQEEEQDQDDNSLSSEAIFVFDPKTALDVDLGDKILLSAQVTEFFGETQLKNIQSIKVIEKKRLHQVKPTKIKLSQLTFDPYDDIQQHWLNMEAYEGMLVKLDEPLVIVEQKNLDRFNEVVLQVGNRTLHPAQRVKAKKTSKPKRIIYDDGMNLQNQSIELLDGWQNFTKYAPRLGDQIINATGILSYSYAGHSSSASTWRLRSHIDGTNHFTRNNPRPSAPAAPEKQDIRFASVNLSNFFKTINNGKNRTTLNKVPRGASAKEITRQRNKLALGIASLNADIIGLTEIENEFDNVHDGSTAIEWLVDHMNHQFNKKYRYIYPGKQHLGTDAIAVGLIYNSNKITASSRYVQTLSDKQLKSFSGFKGHDFSSHPVFYGRATSRQPLACRFTHKTSDTNFVVIVNHLKSKMKGFKSKSGQRHLNHHGYWGKRRLDAAKALMLWQKKLQNEFSSPHVVLMGDFNSYYHEAPTQIILDTFFSPVKMNDYTYTYNGYLGSLDYIFISQSLKYLYNRYHIWHINADEADALDYQLDYQRKPRYFSANSPARFSDHDPVIVDLSFPSKQKPTQIKTIDQNSRH